jgi:hypothetical protein
MDKNGVAISQIWLSSVHEGAEGLVYYVILKVIPQWQLKDTRGTIVLVWSKYI